VEIRKLKPGFEALGVLIDFLAREPPYAQLRAGDLLAAVTYQLSHGLHFAGFEKNRMVAYCGWLTTSAERAEAWLQGKGRLDHVAPVSSDAVALTIVKIPKQEHVLPMISTGKSLAFSGTKTTKAIDVESLDHRFVHQIFAARAPRDVGNAHRSDPKVRR
jgi:hypothetical protein